MLTTVIVVICVVLIIGLIALVVGLNRPQDKSKIKIYDAPVIVEAPPVVAEDPRDAEPASQVKELASSSGVLRGNARVPTGRLPSIEIEAIPVPKSGFFSYLVFRSGSRAGESFDLDRVTDENCVIGRSDVPENHLKIREDTKVSRVCHAEIKRSPRGEYSIIDNDSVNGVWVNDERVAPQIPTVLRAGDRIRLGVTELEYVTQPV